MFGPDSVHPAPSFIPAARLESIVEKRIPIAAKLG
jgi:hypothetical protein